MRDSERFDPATLFSCAVVNDQGRRLGRVVALIHHADGCDVLVERRHWIRYSVLRIDLDDLVQLDRYVYGHRSAQHRLDGGSGDGRVA
ncbi:MAG: hypothetical protein ABI352_12055 [Candidatus Dormibacter sp.]